MILLRIISCLISIVLVSSELHYNDNVGHVIESINDFGFDLLKIFSEDQKLKDENLFYSPTSISLSIAMVFLGSRGNTARQIAQAYKWYKHEYEDVHLALKSLQEAILEMGHDNLELKIANQIWGHNELEETAEFKENSLEFYNSPIAKVDFKWSSEEARKEINNWVEKNTARKIKGFLPPGSVNQDTRLALINAIYFKGTWQHAFLQERTYHAPFYTSSDLKNIFEVEMMSRTAKHNYFTDEEKQCKILELPYSGGEISMFIVLPHEVNGVSELEKMLTTDILFRWVNSVENTTVEMSLPKFILSQHFELKEVLYKLGVIDIFEPDLSDLSGLSSVERLHVSHVIHKAHVHVTEQGTEAAAASGVLIQKRSIDPHPEFHANHPFLFFIYHKSSHVILFIGRVSRPQMTEQESAETGGDAEIPDFGHPIDEL